jgi:NitT/TauT family transport system substrate-binding protein
MHRFALGILASLLIVACGGTSAPSASPSPGGKPEKASITMAIGGQFQIIYMPATLAQSLGYYKDEGLTVDIQSLKGGADALKALTGGSVDVVTGFYEHTIRTQTEGKKIEMITVFDAYPGLVFLVGKKHVDQVKTIKDLQGKPVGITSAGSSTEEMVRYLAKQAGMDPLAVPTVGVGSGSSAIAALTSDQIWALVTVEPAASTIEKANNGKAIYDTRTAEGTKQVFGGSWPAGGYYLMRDFVKANPNTAQALARAGVRTLKWMKSHSAEEIAAKLPKEFYGEDKDFFIQVLKANLGMFSPDGLMPADGPDNVFKTLKVADTKTDWSTVDLKLTYDNTFVKNVK